MATLYGEGGSYNNSVGRYNEIAFRVCASEGVSVFDPNDVYDLLEFEDGLHPDTKSNVILAEYFNTWLGAEYVCIPF